jgi:hypothetical protein
MGNKSQDFNLLKINPLNLTKINGISDNVFSANYHGFKKYGYRNKKIEDYRKNCFWLYCSLTRIKPAVSNFYSLQSFHLNCEMLDPNHK